MRDRLAAVVAAVGVASLGGGLLVVGVTTTATANDQPNVTICHWTGADKYTSPNPSKKQIVDDNGHMDAQDQSPHPQDIIPPFAAGHTGNNSWQAFPGYNWYTRLSGGLTGEQIWTAGCVVPEVETVTPLAPYATKPDCGVAGSLVIPVQPNGVLVSQEPRGTGPGTYTVTFSAAEGFEIPDGVQAVYTVTVAPALAYQSTDPAGACYQSPGPQVVTPAAPSVTAADCGLAGKLVIPAQPAGVVVAQEPAGTGPGSYVITFTAAPGYAFPSGTKVRYDVVVPAALPYQATNPAAACYVPPPPPTDVCTNLAGVQETVPAGYTEAGGICTLTEPQPADLCTNLDGVQSEVPEGYEAEDGVCTLIEPEVQDVCTNLEGVQAEVPDGYVEVGGVCAEVKGEETERPEPVTPAKPNAPAPQPDEVLGTEAALPTTVDAGLAGPTGPSGPTNPLGLSLMSAGLGLMALAAAMKAGRRERGVHEV